MSKVQAIYTLFVRTSKIEVQAGWSKFLRSLKAALYGGPLVSHHTQIRHISHKFARSHTNSPHLTQTRHITHKFASSHTNSSYYKRIQHIPTTTTTKCFTAWSASFLNILSATTYCTDWRGAYVRIEVLPDYRFDLL